MSLSLRYREGTYVRDLPVRLGLQGRHQPRAYWYRGFPNLGDAVSPDLIEWMIGQRPVWVSRTFRRKILGVGSILHQALTPGDTVWGAGLIADRRFRPPDDATFLAVRGPLTRDRIEGDVPEVYGDPAILLPRLYAPEVPTTHAVGIVPHFFDRGSVTSDDPSVRLIDVTRPWRDIVDSILGCEVIVSSSLHGIVVAEAYGVPAAWTRISDADIGNGFKFNDYLLASGRDRTEPVPFSCGLSAIVDRALPEATLDTEPLLQSGRSGLSSIRR